MKFEFKFFDISKNKVRLDKYLSSQIKDISRGQIQYLIKNGSVTVNDIVVNESSYKLHDTMTVSIDYDQSKFVNMSIAPDNNIPLNIIYEDDDIIVINKQSGIVVHPAPGNCDKTLVNALMYHTKGKLGKKMDDNINNKFRPGIVHRIDKETSGVIVIAKTTEALINLQKQFEKHDIHRIYYAICFGKPKKISDTIETMIAYNPKKQKQIINRIYSNKKIRTAITSYETISTFNMNNKYISFIRCKLKTGRTHQIRVHMEYIGNSVIGDKLYGNNQRQIDNYDHNVRDVLNKITRHLLHASELGFNHPITGKQLIFKSNLPDDMKTLIDFCKKNYITI